MTLRIDRAAGAGPAMLVLHGWLSVDDVAVFDKTIEETGQPLRIDLGQLVGADSDGLRALHRQQARGTRLTGASPFMELLLKRSEGGPEGNAGE